MKKGRIIVLLVVVALVAVLLPSCNGVTRNSVVAAGDTVSFASVKLSDTTSFVKRNGERVAIFADATMNYPSHYRDPDATLALQRLFITQLLDQGDTLTLQEAMKAYVGNTLHQFDMVPADAPATEEMEDDGLEDAVYKYNTSTSIVPMRNANGVVTLVKVEVVKKNDEVTSLTHRYFTVDLHTMTLVDPSKLFREDAIATVCQLMKAELMRRNQVTTEEQLNDLGYFNVDNIVVSRNFYFDEQGVTWSFLPGVLAVEALGEPCITLPYDVLKDFVADGSVLERVK